MLNTKHPTTGNITAPTDVVNDTTTINAFDLVNIQGTFENLITAFDDIATVTALMLNGNLHNYQKEALLRLLQSHAYEYMNLCEGEYNYIDKHLAGTSWGKGGQSC